MSVFLSVSLSAHFFNLRPLFFLLVLLCRLCLLPSSLSPLSLQIYRCSYYPRQTDCIDSMNPPHSGHSSSRLLCSPIPPLFFCFFLTLMYFFSLPLCFGFPLLCSHSHSGSVWMWFRISNRLSASVFSLSKKIMVVKVTNDTDLLFTFTCGIPSVFPCLQVQQAFIHTLQEIDYWVKVCGYYKR